jgi:hypothetical protein
VSYTWCGKKYATVAHLWGGCPTSGVKQSPQVCEFKAGGKDQYLIGSTRKRFLEESTRNDR